MTRVITSGKAQYASQNNINKNSNLPTSIIKYQHLVSEKNVNKITKQVVILIAELMIKHSMMYLKHTYKCNCKKTIDVLIGTSN